VRALGIDFGLKRMGLAVSDPAGTMAFPRETLVRTDNAALFARLQALITAEKIEVLVVGLPLSMDGEETTTSGQARKFGRKLAAATGLPLHFVDERLTSAEAAERLKEAGTRRGQVKGALDAVAATIILEAYLAGQKGQP